MIKYPTSLTNSRWQCIKKILNDKRKRKVSLRKVREAVFLQGLFKPRDYRLPAGEKQRAGRSRKGVW